MEKTDVMFRFWGNEVIALFPAQAGTNNYYVNCGSYMHIGQHGSCDLMVIRRSRKATPEEYAPLFKELTNRGYDLRIVRKVTRRHYQSRQAEVNRIGVK